ncbi:serine hydrolase [Nesterenkonia populi]|uniref:serine hydrolase n=1 Tax=Nesterenkonia populi TaxID=1591087 RepID=UPI0011BDB3E7|nr:serine hydrolase [Nesterenkonia populi]
MKKTLLGWGLFVAGVIVLVSAAMIGGGLALVHQPDQEEREVPAPAQEEPEPEDEPVAGDEPENDPEAEEDEPAAHIASEVLAGPADTDLNVRLEEILEGRPGEYSVSLIELSGEGRHAAYSADAPMEPASTYKLYVAYSALKQVEAGELAWDQAIADGRDLDQCFYDMIAVSDNPCAEELLYDVVGRDQIVADLPETGVETTSFEVGDVHTTAEDLAGMLARWESGELPLDTESDAVLMDAMAENIHRDGIPAGVSGDVHDKVGFIDGYLHDAAVIHDEAGTWVLTILTEGSSWDEIAEIAEEAEAALGR